MGASLVLVPTYNERENLPRLLPRLSALETDLDVLVIDDAYIGAGERGSVSGTQTLDSTSDVCLITTDGTDYADFQVVSIAWAESTASTFLFWKDNNPQNGQKDVGESSWTVGVTTQ